MQNILEVCSGGASKTKIVYQSNLNFNTVNSYMTQLKDNGLLDVIQGEPIIYKTTKKGSEFMRCLKQHHEEISKITSILVPVKLMTTTLICLSGAITIISSLNGIIQDWWSLNENNQIPMVRDGWLKKTAASWAYRLAAIIFARGMILSFICSIFSLHELPRCHSMLEILLPSGPLDSFLFQCESVVHLYDRPLECEKRSTASTESIIFVKCRDV